MLNKEELLSKKSININDKVYNIVESFESTDVEGYYEYIVYKTDDIKIKNFYAWYPLWIGKKFRWFKRVNVKYIYYISYRLEFDEYSMSRCWTGPKGEFRMSEILN